MYQMLPHIVVGLARAELATLEIPTEADYVAAYCRRTGHDGIPTYEFYIAFNLFRLAAIFTASRAEPFAGLRLQPTRRNAHKAFRSSPDWARPDIEAGR